MMDLARTLCGAFRHSKLARRAAYLALAALACSTTPIDSDGGAGAGGSAGTNTGGGAGTLGGAAGSGGSSGASGSKATGGANTGGGAATGAVGGGGSGTGGAATGGTAGGAATGGGGTGGVAGGAATGGTMAGTSAGGSSAGTSGAGGETTGGTSAGGTSAGAGSGGGPGVRSAGCGKTPTLTFEQVPGESGQNVGTGEGGYVRIGDRGFAIRLPDDYDKDKPYWLIFGFHWNGGNSKEVDTGGSNGYEMAHFGLQKLSNNGAIFVAPDGIGSGWANSGGRDLEFVDQMVELISETYCVDTSHIFANGFSYGGGMSYAIACARADVFRGVAIYNGAVLSGCDGGDVPIAYWQMAGQTDTVCTIGAGRSMRDRFVETNGCTPQNPPEPPPPPPYLSPGGHICTTYEGCESGYPVRWCAHQSGHGNAIVDGTDDLFHSCATPPNSCSDSCPCSWVPGDVWSFFTSL